MKKYNVTETHFAKIAYKNHKHSVNNPYSQFREEYTLEQIMQSPKVRAPLTKLQCCPTSDGGACVILASYDFVVKHGLQGQVPTLPLSPSRHPNAELARSCCCSSSDTACLLKGLVLVV